MILKRDGNDLTPTLGLDVCGCPCQAEALHKLTLQRALIWFWFLKQLLGTPQRTHLKPSHPSDTHLTCPRTTASCWCVAQGIRTAAELWCCSDHPMGGLLLCPRNWRSFPSNFCPFSSLPTILYVLTGDKQGAPGRV